MMSHLIVVLRIINGLALVLILGAVFHLTLLLVGSVIDCLIDGFADILHDGGILCFALLLVDIVTLEAAMQNMV